MGEPRFGVTEPRIWTRPLRPLTPETTLGFDVIEFAKEILRVELLPWQKWALVHMLEIKENGEYRFRRVLIEVARQNGKTTLAVILTLWRMYVDHSTYVLGTAQNLDTSRETWLEAVQYAQHTPELSGAVEQVRQGNTGLELKLTNGAVYRVASASRQGARSKSADTIIMDELREHYNWDGWNAATNTAIAQRNSLTLCLSNAGDHKSVVLATLRKQGIAQIKSGGSFAYYGWSAPEKAKVDDRDAWAQANPALGYTITEDALAAQLADVGDAIEGFRTENLCQWVKAIREPYLPREAWGKCLDADSQIMEGSPLAIGIDTAVDRSFSAVAVAGWRSDGVPHVEVVAARSGMVWVPDWVREFIEKHAPGSVMIQARGCPASELTEPLGRLQIKARLVQGTMLGAATGQFKDRVVAGELRHIGQPALDVAAGGALVRSVAEAQAWARTLSKPVDICPLVAASWALYGLVNPVETDKRLSAYREMPGDWWLTLPAASGTREGGEPATGDADEENRDWWEDL